MKNLLRRIFGKASNNEVETQVSGITTSNSKSSIERSVELDALEPRVLFSGAPVESQEEEVVQSDVQSSGANEIDSAASGVVSTEQGVVGDQTGLDQR